MGVAQLGESSEYWWFDPSMVAHDASRLVNEFFYICTASDVHLLKHSHDGTSKLNIKLLIKQKLV